MDNFVDETRKLRVVQRAVSLGDSSLNGLMYNPTMQEGGNTRSIARSTCLWIIFGLWAWHYPRYLIRTMSQAIQSKTPPYQVTAAGDVILDFSLNEKVSDPPIVSSELLKLTSLYLPLIITMLHGYLSTRRRHRSTAFLEICTVLACFSMAIGLSEGTTQLLKLWIQRRRPSFYDLCGFDIQTRTCRATSDYVLEANLSFPSGHSSLSCCGMTFLVWYFLGKIRAPERWVAFLIAVVPWGWSVFVAGSRLVDNWHHPSDVIAGLGLGFAACTIAYHIWYPPIWSSLAGRSKSLPDDVDPATS